MPKVADTIIGDSTFGKMWRVIIREFFVPIERAERTNSRSFNAKTSPRTIRAVGIQLVIPIAVTIKMKIPVSGPNAPFNGSRNNSIITNSNGKIGNAKNRSVRRIKGPSKKRKNPAKTPTNVPKTNDRPIAAKPTEIEVCPPAIIRAKVSRPN